MGLSWRSSSSEGVSHEGVADVDVGVDVDVNVNAAVNDAYCNGQNER